MSLHLVFSQPGYARCLERRAQSDVVVLLGDAVYSNDQSGCFYLQEDLAVRGVEAADKQTVDYNGLVALTTQHNPIVSWND